MRPLRKFDHSTRGGLGQPSRATLYHLESIPLHPPALNISRANTDMTACAHNAKLDTPLKRIVVCSTNVELTTFVIPPTAHLAIYSSKRLDVVAWTVVRACWGFHYPNHWPMLNRLCQRAS